MARRAPSDYGVSDPTVHVDYGYGAYDGNGGGQEPAPEPEEPIPGWRKPIALVGWGILIAVLIGLIIWGIIQLAQGAPPQEPATTTTTATTTTKTTPPSSAPPVVPPTQHRTQEETTTTPTTDISTPTASTEDTGTPTTTSTPRQAARIGWLQPRPRGIKGYLGLDPAPGSP